MNLAQWFYAQLPDGLGEWTAARHAFHMVYCEQTIALPSMRQWLGDACPSMDGLDEDVAWDESQANVEDLLADFSKVRMEQVALLSQFDVAAWNTMREAIWG